MVVENAHPGPVEEEDFQRGPPLPKEDEQRAAPGHPTELCVYEARQAVEAPPQVDGHEAHEDLHARRNHRFAPWTGFSPS